MSTCPGSSCWQYLLKPCLLVMPIWIVLWVLDCIEVHLAAQILCPFFYFGICHVIMPAVLVWYLFQTQAAGEALCLEQSRSRREEAGCTVPVVSEDPSPTFLKELIAMNPVALICLVLLVMIRRTAVYEVIATSTRDPTGVAPCSTTRRTRRPGRRWSWKSSCRPLRECSRIERHEPRAFGASRPTSRRCRTTFSTPSAWVLPDFGRRGFLSLPSRLRSVRRSCTSGHHRPPPSRPVPLILLRIPGVNGGVKSTR